MLIYDFEVFKHDWLLVAVDVEAEDEHVIVNDSRELRNLYQDHKDDIWVGFNSRNYDVYIMKALLCGDNPYEVSQFIIDEGRKGWEFNRQYLDIVFYNFDCYLPFFGLKTLEGFMGDMVKESSIPFDIDRKLTDEEIEETVRYCRHDVLETMKVFTERSGEFYAMFDLLKEFDLPLKYISKTKAQLSAIILGAVKSEDRDDEWDFEPEKCIKIEKYKEVYDWFVNPENRVLGKKLEIEVAGVPHVFGWGGAHGAVPNYFGEGDFINVDVASFYPSLMIEWDMLSRNVQEPERFTEIKEKRLLLKKEGNKKAQAPLKIVLNSTYGASGDKYNALYDPRQAHRVCMNGQLMLLDLIEKLEPHCDIIQSNTDGVLIKVTPESRELCINICHDWENRTRMELEFDDFSKIIQRDVNNYVLVPMSNKVKDVKSKGAVVKKIDVLDNDLAIIKKAVINWFVDKIPPEKTIWDAEAIIDFQKIYKVSSLYKEAYQGCTFRKESVVTKSGRKGIATVWNGDGVRLYDKTYRVFASKESRGALYKKKDNKNPEKFASCPDNCFIENESIVGKLCREYKELDKQWYVDLAWKNIKAFDGSADFV